MYYILILVKRNIFHICKLYKERHQKKCLESSQKQRKVFSSQQNRLAGTELAKFNTVSSEQLFVSSKSRQNSLDESKDNENISKKTLPRKKPVKKLKTTEDATKSDMLGNNQRSSPPLKNLLSEETRNLETGALSTSNTQEQDSSAARVSSKISTFDKTQNQSGSILQNDTSDNRAACVTCGRKFNEAALERHAPKCAESASKKRSTFDSVKNRVKGSDLESYAKENGQTGQYFVIIQFPILADNVFCYCLCQYSLITH